MKLNTHITVAYMSQGGFLLISAYHFVQTLAATSHKPDPLYLETPDESHGRQRHGET